MVQLSQIVVAGKGKYDLSPRRKDVGGGGTLIRFISLWGHWGKNKVKVSVEGRLVNRPRRRESGPRRGGKSSKSSKRYSIEV